MLQVVTFEDGENLAREFNIPFFETSAMNNINVDDAFMRITKDVTARIAAGGMKTGLAVHNNTVPNAPKQQISASNVAPPRRRSWC